MKTTLEKATKAVKPQLVGSTEYSFMISAVDWVVYSAVNRAVNSTVYSAVDWVVYSAVNRAVNRAVYAALDHK